jgi:cytochrome c
MIFAFLPQTRRAAGLIAALAGAALAGAAAAQPAATNPAPADFAVCSACHESTAKAPPSVAPNLFGVAGRKAGSAPDFDYSDAMKASTIVWSADTLAAFILDPAKTIPGNKMDYGGAPDAKAAQAIADYLMTLKP